MDSQKPRITNKLDMSRIFSYMLVRRHLDYFNNPLNCVGIAFDPNTNGVRIGFKTTRQFINAYELLGAKDDLHESLYELAAAEEAS